MSIGSNDLTQLTLGIDRDSEILAKDFDERDPAVKKMVSLAIQGNKRNKKHSGLCGQAPSDYPEFAQFLVEEGIDSISINPDTVMKITLKVLETEKTIGEMIEIVFHLFYGAVRSLMVSVRLDSVVCSVNPGFDY